VIFSTQHHNPWATLMVAHAHKSKNNAKKNVGATLVVAHAHPQKNEIKRSNHPK